MIVTTRKRIIFLSLCFFSLFICVVCSDYKVFSFISVAVYVSYWIYLYLVDKTYFVKYLAFLFSAVATVVGAIVIELFPRMHLNELSCTSGFSGSLPLLIFSYWIFLYVLEVREYKYGKKIELQADLFKDSETKKNINLMAAVTFILFLIHFAYVVTHSTMMIGKRFGFSAEFKMPWIIQKIGDLTSLMLIFPMLALIYANHLLGTVTVALYIVQEFWTGSKFGAFFSILCILLMVMYNKIRSIEKKRLKKILACTAIVLFLLVYIAIIIQSFVYQFDPLSYFTGRIAQQGQLWWRTYELYHGETHPGEFVNEISAFFEGDKAVSECVNAKNGIYKVMYLCAPNSVVSNLLAGGVRYTEGAYPVMYYYFGALGPVIFSVLMGLAISSIVNAFISALQKKKFIKAMCYVHFFTIIRISFSMFTFGAFTGTISLLSYLYLIFDFLTRKRMWILRK